MPRPSIRSLIAAVFLGSALPPLSQAQTAAAFTACSQGVLANCALIELTSHAGAGPGGMNLFRLAVANLGSQTTPTMATSIYNLVFATGQAAAEPGSEIDAAVSPAPLGGTTITDGTAWDVFDSGDFVFLSALAGNGVGNCIAAASVGGFGQAGNTCATGQFLAFDLFTSRIFDPTAFTIADLEIVGLRDDLPADSCNDATPCAVTSSPVTPTPEPGAFVLLVTGLGGIAVTCRRHFSTLFDSLRAS